MATVAPQPQIYTATTTSQGVRPDPFAGLAREFDKESLSWLNHYAPGIYEELERMMAQDDPLSPDEIRRFAIRYTRREEIALRVEAAARALARENGNYE